jgi:S-adenosylmethionine-dependent methyltransferase
MTEPETETPHWVANRVLPPREEQRLRERLTEYFGETAALASLEDHVQHRPYWFQTRYVPWLASVIGLKGLRVLEIGCGTGSSTIQIAERGASVVATDIDAAALDVVRFRAELHGVADRIQTRRVNAAEIGADLRGSYDIIAYCAALEHMTHAERQASLTAAWAMLGPGQLLVIVDTPNRLWYFDNHTTFCNFFHWLPDSVAVDYATHVNRPDFTAELSDPGLADPMLSLARWGRGVSFHDLQLALGPLETLEIAGEWDYRRAENPAWDEAWQTTLDGRYQALLREMTPNLPRPWFESELAMAIRKPEAL